MRASASFTAGELAAIVTTAMLLGGAVWDRIAVAPERRRRRTAEWRSQRLAAQVDALERAATVRARDTHPTSPSNTADRHRLRVVPFDHEQERHA